MRLLAVLAVVLAACSGGGTGGGAGGGAAGGTGGGAAGGTGGGTPDAGNPVCGSDGGLPGPSKCSCAGFTLCESFEGSAVDTATWTLDTSQGTAVLDTAKFARGGKSLHVNVKSGAGSRALLTTGKSFPAANNSFFGRAFVFAQGPIPKVHTGMFHASGAGTEVRLGIDHDGDLEPNYMSPSNEYGVFTANKAKLPTGKWVCLEWEYRGTGELHFFLDGAEMAEIQVLTTETPPWTAPAYSKFQLGLIMFQPDTATAASFDMWFDEVALGATRIGCRN